MTVLLDSNVLIALSYLEHPHHETAVQALGHWDDFATCPVTEGALTRFLIRMGETPVNVTAALKQIGSLPTHQFWPDDLPYADVDLAGLRGHRQVTDTYLAALAAHRGAKLVTFDKGLAAANPKTALLLT
ncbi:MAG: PIN domain-containing protein [Propionibacteriaceae bacterium]|jgi:toxin-antitoxin system PIN domain toxin|nr:PIN domain-containing protein [Propionibacteriaceae bacterium]